MAFNPKSLENLGKPKTKAGRKNFSLNQASHDWLASQKNQSQTVENLIKEQIMIGRLAEWLEGNVHCIDNSDDRSTIVVQSRLTNKEIWEKNGCDVKDLTRMYGESEANRKPTYGFKWRGSVSQKLWIQSAKRILSDPDAGMVTARYSGQSIQIDL